MRLLDHWSMLERAGAASALVLAVMILLRGVQIRFRPHPEIIRKTLHVTGGLVALSFPWTIKDPAWVIMLSLSMAFFFWLLQRVSILRAHLGAVTGEVKRRSLGEIAFPLGVGLLYLAAQGNSLFYAVALLILTFADTAAALVGIRYGRIVYETPDGRKSAEGSLIFFFAAFFLCHAVLLAFSDMGKAQSLAIAFLLGAFTTLLEAAAWRGLDNLFLPVASVLLLRYLAPLPLAHLAAQAVFMVLLLGGFLATRKWTTLNHCGTLAAVLIGYLVLSLGGWQWFLPAVLVLFAYPFLAPRKPADAAYAHNSMAVFAVASPALVWLFGWKMWGGVAFYPIYILSMAVGLALIGMARWNRVHPAMPAWKMLALTALPPWLLLCLPSWYWSVDSASGFLPAVCMVLILAACACFRALMPDLSVALDTGRRWLAQSVCGLGAGGVLAGLLLHPATARWLEGGMP